MSPLVFAVLLAAAPPEEVRLEDQWRLRRTITIQSDLHHVQGIDIEDQTLWISSVDAKAKKGYLTRVALPSGRVELQVEVQQGARIHPGGIMLDGDSIWIPVAEYDRDGPSTIERRNKRTLAIESSFEVADHIGCIAAGRDALYGGSWSSRTLYGWSKAGVELWKKPNPIATAWQDLKMDGAMLVGSGNLSREAGAIEWVDLAALADSAALRRRLVTGRTDRGVLYTNEGMTLRGGFLYLLPEDAPTRLFEFERSPPKR